MDVLKKEEKKETLEIRAIVGGGTKRQRAML